MFVGASTSLQVASIGQAIMQRVRPKAIIAPLKLGLAVQMHHHFASKFLIETLNAMVTDFVLHILLLRNMKEMLP
jgi:hypothetical protein